LFRVERRKHTKTIKRPSSRFRTPKANNPEISIVIQKEKWCRMCVVEL
jgi:hypothetical protein